jgi:hypothetical protein
MKLSMGLTDYVCYVETSEAAVMWACPREVTLSEIYKHPSARNCDEDVNYFLFPLAVPESFVFNLLAHAKQMRQDLNLSLFNECQFILQKWVGGRGWEHVVAVSYNIL